MLELDKNQVEFLVTKAMVQEVSNVLDTTFEKIAAAVDALAARNTAKLFFVGCGSSKAVGDTSKYLCDKHTDKISLSMTGWAFVDNPPMALDKGSAVVLTSQTGRTEEVVAAMRKCRDLGVLTIAVTRDPEGSPLAEESDFVIDYNAHANWECQMLVHYLLVLQLAAKHETLTESGQQLLGDLVNLPDVLAYHIEHAEADALAKAKSVAHWKGFYTVAAGPLLPLAYKEGMITNMEFLRGHGSVIESGEFRHGPLEIVEPGVPFVFLLGTDSSRHITERALRFVRKHGSEPLVFDYRECCQGLHEDLAPFVLFVPLEWFSYYFALVRNHNPDNRRYYGVVEF